jgi:hypothetical protein
MSVAAAQILLSLLSLYAAIGVLAAFALLAGGLRRLDSLAAAAPWRVKLILAPGLVALWPVMVMKALAPETKEGAS